MKLSIILISKQNKGNVPTKKDQYLSQKDKIVVQRSSSEEDPKPLSRTVEGKVKEPV